MCWRLWTPAACELRRRLKCWALVSAVCDGCWRPPERGERCPWPAATAASRRTGHMGTQASTLWRTRASPTGRT